MLWGTEAYKSLWARDARTLRRIHLFPPHAAAGSTGAPSRRGAGSDGWPAAC